MVALWWELSVNAETKWTESERRVNTQSTTTPGSKQKQPAFQREKPWNIRFSVGSIVGSAVGETVGCVGWAVGPGDGMAVGADTENIEHRVSVSQCIQSEWEWVSGRHPVLYDLQITALCCMFNQQFTYSMFNQTRCRTVPPVVGCLDGECVGVGVG